MAVKLMIPGPVDIPEEVRDAMAVPAMPHYGDAWIRLYGETQEMAKRVFGTHNDLYIMPGPGTMALEAALGSALEPGDTILIPSNGFFAERLQTMAKGLGLQVLSLAFPLAEPITAEPVEAALREHPEVKALAIVHHETSTGVLNPLQRVLEGARAHGVLTVVDAISSLGGVPLPVDEWGVDFCATVANKALETPPGVALLSISPDAWKAIEARQAPRGWYLDLKTWRWYMENWGSWHPSPVTMPTSNINALHTSLMALLEEGLETRYAQYRAAAVATRAGLRALEFPMFTPDEWASPLMTAFCMRPAVDADSLQQALLRDSGVMISGGLTELHGKILRVGHIGLARRRDYVVAFLLGVEDYLRQTGVAVAPGQSLGAVAQLK